MGSSYVWGCCNTWCRTHHLGLRLNLLGSDWFLRRITSSNCVKEGAFGSYFLLKLLLISKRFFLHSLTWDDSGFSSWIKGSNSGERICKGTLWTVLSWQYWLTGLLIIDAPSYLDRSSFSRVQNLGNSSSCWWRVPANRWWRVSTNRWWCIATLDTRNHINWQVVANSRHAICGIVLVRHLRCCILIADFDPSDTNISSLVVLLLNLVQFLAELVGSLCYGMRPVLSCSIQERFRLLFDFFDTGIYRCSVVSRVFNFSFLASNNWSLVGWNLSSKHRFCKRTKLGLHSQVGLWSTWDPHFMKFIYWVFVSLNRLFSLLWLNYLSRKNNLLTAFMDLLLFRLLLFYSFLFFLQEPLLLGSLAFSLFFLRLLLGALLCLYLRTFLGGDLLRKFLFFGFLPLQLCSQLSKFVLLRDCSDIRLLYGC